ncbi:hypothetical protein CO251_10185 [Sulfobacillus sp. hq2]|nr:hypothetical protein CO251_10185 [Sulfobacillus sp. hq2]
MEGMVPFMNPRKSVKWSILLSLPLALAGCGFHHAASAPNTSRPKTLRQTSPSPSPSPSASPSPSQTPSSPSTSSSSSPATQSVQAPPPPGAGPYTGLKVAVVAAVPEGTSTVSGQRLNVYRLTVTVDNPTSGIIGLALDDLAVDANGASYAWNDYVQQGLTASNSLFAFPLTPKSPASDVTQILPGRPLTAELTIQAPSASQYVLVWNGTSTPTGPQATFH